LCTVFTHVISVLPAHQQENFVSLMLKGTLPLAQSNEGYTMKGSNLYMLLKKNKPKVKL